MPSYICKEVINQILEQEKIVNSVKENIQTYNQKLKSNPALGLDPKGPMNRILSSLQDVQFFFDQFMKCHGLKYLPIKEDEQPSE